MRDLNEYYQKRAREYEEIYHRDIPSRMNELEIIAKSMQDYLKDLDVLEIAAGTGYWSKILSKTAKSILITDGNQEPLSIAQSKNYECSVQFSVLDAYNIPVYVNCSGCLANLWFSHIPKEKLDIFFEGLHKTGVQSIFMADNNFVPSVGGILIDTDKNGNTYKLRTLQNGSQHTILKNYYSFDELADFFSKFDPNFSENSLFYGEHFWFVKYAAGKHKAKS